MAVRIVSGANATGKAHGVHGDDHNAGDMDQCSDDRAKETGGGCGFCQARKNYRKEKI